MLQEFGFGESQFFECGDFGAFKERLRSVGVEEIGQAGEGLPRVSGGGFAPFGSRFGVRVAACILFKIATYISPRNNPRTGPSQFTNLI